MEKQKSWVENFIVEINNNINNFKSKMQKSYNRFVLVNNIFNNNEITDDQLKHFNKKT